MAEVDLTYDVDFAPAISAIGTLVAATGRPAAEVVRQQSRLLIEDAISLTPPNGGGVTGVKARKRGEAAVDRDLIGKSGLFAGVRLKGRRKITTVFGRKLKKPVYVKTTDLHPDVQGIYDRRKDRRFQPHHGFDVMSRGQKAAWYVDRDKLNALRAKQKATVGKLASGWLPALHALKAQAAQWIERQLSGGTRGRFTEHLDENVDDPFFEAACQVKGDVRFILTKRLQAAVQLRANAIRRAIPHILQHAIKTAQL